MTGAEFDDPNIDRSQIGDIEEDSPYPEVRSAVANTDDPTMPSNSLRTWVMGIAWAILIPGLNQFFFFRYPSVQISPLVAQLLSFPLGRAWAAWMPNVKIFGISVNPGPFTVKECANSCLLGMACRLSVAGTFLSPSWRQLGRAPPTQ